VHYSGIVGTGFRTLHEGQIVEYVVQEGIKGPQAHNVSTVGESEEGFYTN
jgi:CspA family cold shock protein